jgi:hypothetical protein
MYVLAGCSCKFKYTGLSHADFMTPFLLFARVIEIHSTYINKFNYLAPFRGCKQLHSGVTLSKHITASTVELASKACSRWFPSQQNRLRPQLCGTLNNDRSFSLFTVCCFLTLSRAHTVSPPAAFSTKLTWNSEISTYEYK